MLWAAPGHAFDFSFKRSLIDSDPYQPRNLYGEYGLIDMPSARMAPDGQIALTFSAMKNTQRYGFTFQALPWLEGAFRYSHLAGFNGHDYYDRSFGFKLRLFEEGALMPELAVGIRDIVGTGIYGGEYIVASKRLFRDVEVTAGMGWGRLGSSGALPNPVGAVFSSFKDRRQPDSTGQFEFDQLFRGEDVGLFGGVIWQTPIRNLSFIAEYSSDRYLPETGSRLLDQRTPFSFGMSYRLFNHFTLGASYLYGDTVAISVSIDADPTKPLQSVRLGTPPPPVVVRTLEEQQAAIVALQNRNLIGSQIARADSAATRQYSDVDILGQALAASGTQVVDFEVNGSSLLVNIRDQISTGQCRSFARMPELTAMHIRAVAVTNLHKADGAVVTCDVAQQAPVVRLASNDPTLMAAALATGPLKPQAAPVSAAKAEKAIRQSAKDHSIIINAMRQTHSEIWVYYSNHQYYLEAEAMGRLTRIVMQEAPPSVEVVHLISVEHGVPLREVRVLRSSLERVLLANGNVSELKGTVKISAAPMSNPAYDAAIAQNYPRFSWAISPQTRQSLFDPELPLQAQFLVALSSSVDIYPGISVTGSFDINIYNNFTDSYGNDSVLPHVRSDVQKYYDKGVNGVANFEVNYRARLSPNVYTKIKAGYLEDMFAGIGAEVIWRPENSRLVFGADLYQVWQRNYDRLFGFLPYDVVTGHLSVYYESPWYGLNFHAKAGRYLAGDYGGTLEVTRRFASGMELGAFATFTNVPFSRFGEGSFDKGIRVRIPLEWGLPIHSQSSYSLLMRPVQRDGGQRLANDDSLYEETHRTGYGEIWRHLDGLPNP